MPFRLLVIRSANLRAQKNEKKESEDHGGPLHRLRVRFSNASEANGEEGSGGENGPDYIWGQLKSNLDALCITNEPAKYSVTVCVLSAILIEVWRFYACCLCV